MEDCPSSSDSEENDEFHRFKTVKKKGKDKVYHGRKAPNTHKATQVWIKCLNDYLTEKQLGTVDSIDTEEMPAILSDFYVELRKTDRKGEYKMSTLKCIRAAVNRYYKDKREIDIINDRRFIKCNEMFKGVTRKAKREGRGETNSRPPIEEEDMHKLSEYFAANLSGPPHPQKLQEMVLFYIIYYMSRRGRQNLRTMTKETFAVTTDAAGREYIYQAVGELDKNHNESVTTPNSQARIYENKGKLNFICTWP